MFDWTKTRSRTTVVVVVVGLFVKYRSLTCGSLIDIFSASVTSANKPIIDSN